MSDQKKILATLSQAVVDYDADNCKIFALKALESGVDPAVAVLDGLAVGMKRVGILYDTNEYFVPEVLMCAEALYKGLEILKPHIKIESEKSRLKVVIGTVKGDIHDIGKNLVKLMFEASGWEVYDLGCNVCLEDFVEKQLEVRADILALSSMMTTTMMEMKKIIPLVKAKRPHCLILIGGAPLNNDIADLFGADGYADSAGKAVSQALKMIERANHYKKNIIYKVQ